MPRSRAKPNSRTAPIAPAPIPLLDSLRGQHQSSNVQNHENDSDLDDSTVTASGWQCNQNDWSDRNTVNRTPDVFPRTLRAIERKTEQTKNNFFSTTHSSGQIELSKLTMIVSDLILGKHDQMAYREFLSILQNYSVRSSRDDHLEETVYHLIQSAVSFIRSHQERFDPSQLEECYRQRYLLKSKSSQ